MKIELKSIKHAEFASQETNCYSARIYIDGKAFANVSNDGHGGCDDVYPLDTVRREDLAAFRKRLMIVETKLGKATITSTIKNADGSFWTYPNDLEHECGRLLDDWLRLKEVKKILRRISYLKPDGKLYQLPAKYKPTPAGLERVQQQEWFKPGYVMIAGLTPDAATTALTDGGFFGEVAKSDDDDDEWCTCPPNEDRDATYVPDEYDADGKRTSKHHWTCNTCGGIRQVG